jgi:V/A-type H+-transporting ATPase subunit E
MTLETQVKELEAGLLARARTLVQEHLAKAEWERQRILAESRRRIHQREERELLAAKADADRLYRQRVQAAELRLQGELDRLRWGLVEAVMEQVKQQVMLLREETSRYDSVLQNWLAGAARLIDGDTLAAELNATDHERLAPFWEQFAHAACTNKHIALAGEHCQCSGGVVVRTTDNRIRIDNTFEGRLERFEEALHHTILERLFAALPDREMLLHG